MPGTFRLTLTSAVIAAAFMTTGSIQAKTYEITMAAAPPPMVTFVAAFKNIVSKKINARLKAAGKGDQAMGAELAGILKSI